jgi:maleylpyruvate isomerase
VAARTDNVTDPELASRLLLARRGQAYFSRKLNELSDADFDGPSLLDGWLRRHVAAHVGLNARALTHLTEWASTGVETPMYNSPTQRDEDIAQAATLPVQALRNLSDHAAIHLNVEWRDLAESDWTHLVRTAQGRTVPVSETVWMRTREVWIHAVDLGNGGTFDDFPPELVDAILDDVLRSWDRRRDAESLPTISLSPTDRSGPIPLGGSTSPADAAISLHGSAARLASWATGRGPAGVENQNGGVVPPPPRWL